MSNRILRPRRAIALLLTLSLLHLQACTPAGFDLGGGGLTPEDFQGLAFYLDEPDGLIASIDVSATKSIYVFGRLGNDLTPRDVYQLVLTDDNAPANNVGIGLDNQGRLVELAVGGAMVATYTYSADGGTVTETKPDGTSKSFAINSTLSPQQRLTQLGQQTGNDLSAFFDTFPAATNSPLAKSIRLHAEPQAIQWRLLNAAMSLIGLGLSGAALVALAPEAGAAVILLTVAGHTVALLNTGITLAQLFDGDGKITSDPTVGQLEVGLAATGVILTPLTAGADAAKRGIVILENADLWREAAFGKVDLVVTVLSNSPGPEGSGLNLPPQPSNPPSGDPSDGSPKLVVLSYTNPDHSTGSTASAAAIQLSGDPRNPTITWSGVNAYFLSVDNPITTRVEYAIVAASNAPEGTYLSPPITYGQYNVPNFERYISAATPPAWPVQEGIPYLISVLGQHSYATLTVELR